MKRLQWMCLVQMLWQLGLFNVYYSSDGQCRRSDIIRCGGGQAFAHICLFNLRSISIPVLIEFHRVWTKHESTRERKGRYVSAVSGQRSICHGRCHCLSQRFSPLTMTSCLFFISLRNDSDGDVTAIHFGLPSYVRSGIWQSCATLLQPCHVPLQAS